MGRPKTYDRGRVLDRAMRLFWDKGYEGAHLRELVQVCGISRFSLYKEFGGKEGLFEEAMTAYMAGLEGLAEVLCREPLGLENVRANFAALLEFGFRHGCFALNTIREKHVVPSEAFASVRRMVDNDEALILRNLEAAREAGELPADTDVVGQAKLLVAVTMGLLSYGIVEPDPEGLRSIVHAIEALWA